MFFIRKPKTVLWELVLLMLITAAAGCQNPPQTNILSDSGSSATMSDKVSDSHRLETLYEEKLRELLRDGVVKEETPDTIYYDWFDLDGDGQWEMIVSMGTSQSGCCWLYTCEKDRVVPIEQHCGEKGCIRFYPECQLIMTEQTIGGSVVQSYYRIEQKQLVSLYERGIHVSMNGRFSYSFNGETVDKEEYDRLVQEYEAAYPARGEYVVLGRNRQLTL